MTINGGTLNDGFCPVHLAKGTVKLVGNNFVMSGAFDFSLYWTSSNATVDLSEFTGENFSLGTQHDLLPIEKVILPTGWKLYDINDVELTAIV